MLIDFTATTDWDIDIPIKDYDERVALIEEHKKFYEKLRRKAPTKKQVAAILSDVRKERRKAELRKSIRMFFKSETWSMIKAMIFTIVAIAIFTIACEGIRVARQHSYGNETLHIEYNEGRN